MKTYIASYFASAMAALVLTPVVMRLARRFKVVDGPSARKVHREPMPRAGGVAIFAATYIVAVPLLFHLLHRSAAVDVRTVVALLATSAIIFLVGLADDLFDLPSKLKLLALLAASIVVCSSGLALDRITFGDRGGISLGWLSWPVSILWICGVTTAINFIDGLDGLAAGISAVTAGVIALVAGVSGHPDVLVISLALLGSLCGFLFFNFNPAKVFMGDCGSMFLGFMLATASLLCAKRTGTTAGFALPALAMSIPILDTALTMIRRTVLQRRSLFAAERGHVHHKLLDLGMGHRDAVVLLYGVTLACASVGVGLFFSHGHVAQAILAFAHPAIVLTFFAVVGSLRLGEIANALRRNRGIAAQTKRYKHVFDEMQLLFGAADSFDSWWSNVCTALDRLDFLQLTMQVPNRDGGFRLMEWQRPGEEAAVATEGAAGLTLTLPIRQRRFGGPLSAEVRVATTSPLELAGSRVTLFARLMEEHSLASLPAPKGRHATARQRPRLAEVESLDRASARLAERSGFMATNRLKIAIVHDFLYTYAGAEKVLEQILHLHPEADLFSLFDFLPPEKRGFLNGKPVHSSFIQRLPMARSRHRSYLPLMPLAVEQLDVSGYDIVISSSYVAAKGVLTRPDQLHICYCHSPVRFAWDLQHQYLNEAGMNKGLKSLVARAILHYIRNWDARSANGVDVFVANSDFVAGRIEKFYRRRSTTVYPPVDVDNFRLETKKEEYYLTVSRMVPYKRVDLIAEAFSQMPDKRLMIVGEGPEFEKIRAKAGPNVKLLGHQPFDRLQELMRHARAFVFAAEEDFGIVPVEAQACGTPVIAYGRGGATESVIPGETGILFPEQTVESLIEAVSQFEACEFDPVTIRANAERFSAARFRDEFQALVEREWARFHVPSNRTGNRGMLFISPQLAEQAVALRAKVVEADRESAFA
jgi:UDP-N-acetylmuramyl pentapeptide phosphotransferase/UDP-N-acetylglucosamine-1-phosphate transferase/glycosyltransferase involved in cell wall biosynthesis